MPPDPAPGEIQGHPFKEKKRYQVFVSSTFTDLEQERRQVIETLLSHDCIPSGMEWFGAVDEAQFEFIKTVIDDCDYYIVIVAGRYGTPGPGGKSYTEREYDYAVSKGLEVLAFIHDDPDSITGGKLEKDPKVVAKLEKFRTKLRKGRLVSSWDGKERHLSVQVSAAITRAIRTRPAVGWVRANQVASLETLQELNELRKANKALEKEADELQGRPKAEGIAGLDESVTLGGTYRPPLPPVGPGYGASRRRPPSEPKDWSISLTWKEVFGAIAPEIMNAPNDEKAYELLSGALFARSRKRGSDHRLDRDAFQTVKVHLIGLGLIECALGESVGNALRLFWQLTPAGERAMLDARVVRTALPPEAGP